MAADDDFDEYEHHYAIRPNKSELKRENTALEALGEELIALPKERLRQWDLPAELLEAVVLAQNISRHHGAFKRQRKYIAKLLRDMDITSIRGQLDRHAQQDAQATYQLHLIERWRDRLLGGGDAEINALMAEHPDADRQKLRQLVRDAGKEQAAGKPPRSARLLFKYLRGLLIPSMEQAGHADEAET